MALSEECVKSATSSLEYLTTLVDLKILNGVSYLEAYYVFHATLLICGLHLARPYDRPETAEDKRRKTLVRNILRSTRITQLAPTYHILSQIAVQFASITGATEEEQEPDPAPRIPDNEANNSQIEANHAAFVDGLDQSLVDDASTWLETDPGSFLVDWFGVYGTDTPESTSTNYAVDFIEGDLGSNQNQFRWLREDF